MLMAEADESYSSEGAQALPGGMGDHPDASGCAQKVGHASCTLAAACYFPAATCRALMLHLLHMVSSSCCIRGRNLSRADSPCCSCSSASMLCGCSQAFCRRPQLRSQGAHHLAGQAGSGRHLCGQDCTAGVSWPLPSCIVLAQAEDWVKPS